MKRMTVLLMSSVLLLSLTACKNQEEPASGKLELSAGVFHKGDTIAITVHDFRGNYEVAPWVGILDTDASISTEVEADDHDIWYATLTEEEHSVFTVTIGEDVDLEPGRYQVVLTDTDDEALNGAVLDSMAFEVQE